MWKVTWATSGSLKAKPDMKLPQACCLKKHRLSMTTESQLTSTNREKAPTQAWSLLRTDHSSQERLERMRDIMGRHAGEVISPGKTK